MNKIYAALTTLLLVLSFSFSHAQLSNKSVSIGGVNRTYKQYLPTVFNPQSESVSLVFILHGLGGTNADMVSAGFNFIADTARAIAIYPQGLQNQYGQNSWNNGTLLSSTANDIGFMNALIDSAILNYNVDPTRVYFTGFSMGSIMSYHMACALNDRVAAVGCMAGTMSTSDIQNCSPEYATPVIHLHGTADGTVPYDGSALPSLSLVDETVNFWRGVHGCDATADSTRLPDSAADNITVDRFVYDNCSPDGSVELWRFNGADHIYLYQPVNDITEMIEVWLFLNRWSHPSPAAAGVSSEEQIRLETSPNPSVGTFTVRSGAEAAFTVHSTGGQLILSGKLQKGETVLDLKEAPAGVYLLQAGNTVVKLMRY